MSDNKTESLPHKEEKAIELPSKDLLHKLLIDPEEFRKIVESFEEFLKGPKNLTSFQLLPFDKKKLEQKGTKDATSLQKLLYVYWRLFLNQIYFYE